MRLVRQFRQVGATSPQTAQPFRPQSAVEELTLSRLESDGIICQALPGRYYLDEQAVRAKQRVQGRLLPWLLVGLLAVALLRIAAVLLS